MRKLSSKMPLIFLILFGGLDMASAYRNVCWLRGDGRHTCLTVETLIGQTCRASVQVELEKLGLVIDPSEMKYDTSIATKKA